MELVGWAAPSPSFATVHEAQHQGPPGCRQGQAALGATVLGMPLAGRGAERQESTEEDIEWYLAYLGHEVGDGAPASVPFGDGTVSTTPPGTALDLESLRGGGGGG
eukprot:9628999-Alexandrium_andersonii.AAC.1